MSESGVLEQVTLNSFLSALPFAHSAENAMVGCGPSLITPTTLASRFGPAAPRVLSSTVLYTPLTSGPTVLSCNWDPSSLCHSPVTLQSNTCNTIKRKCAWLHFITLYNITWTITSPTPITSFTFLSESEIKACPIIIWHIPNARTHKQTTNDSIVPQIACPTCGLSACATYLTLNRATIISR